MADNISNIIDPAVFTDVDKLIASIKDVETEIATVNSKAISVNVDIKGAESLNALSAAMEKQQVLLDELQETYKNNAAVTNEVATANKNLGNAVGDTANKIGGLESRLEGLNILLSQATKGSEGYRNLQTQIAKTSSELDGLKPKIQQVNTELGTTNIQINKTAQSFNILGISGDNIEKMFARQILRMTAYELILAPVIMGISALIESFNALSDAQQEAADTLQGYEDSAKQLRDFQGNILAGEELDRVKYEASIVTIKDKTASIEAQTAAYKYLQNVLPGVTREFSIQDIANSKDDDTMRKKANRIIELTNTLKQNTSTYEQELKDFDKLKKQYEATDTDAVESEQTKSLIAAYIFTKNDLEKRRKEIVDAQVALNEANPELDKAEKEKGRENTNPIKSQANVSNINNEIAAEKEKAEIQHEIWQNEKVDLQERLQANAQYYSLLAGIAALEKQKADEETRNKQNNLRQENVGDESKISSIQSGKTKFKDPQKEITTLRGNIAERNKQITDGDKDLLTHQTTFNTAYEKLMSESGKNVLTIYKSVQDQQLEAQKEVLTAELSAIEENTLQKEQLNKSAYTKGEINAEEHNKRLKKIREQAQEEQTDAEIKSLGQFLLSGDVSGKVKEQIEARIVALQRKKLKEIDKNNKNNPSGAMSELEAGVDSSKESATDDKSQLQINLEEIQHFTNQAIETYTSFYDAIKQMRDNAFQAEQQQLEIQMKAVTLQAQQKQAAILGTTNFQITKDNQLAQLAAQTTAQQNSIQAQENALALKKAKADKTSAEMTVILNTAKGISATFPLWATDPALAAIEVAIITALGVAQYGAAASTPLPQFFTGGTTSTPYFVAAEKGRELMTFPSGEQRIAEKPGIYNAPIGTKIDPNHITEVMIKNASSTLGMSVYDLYKFKGNDMTDERIVKKLDDVESTLVDIHRSGNRGHQTIIKVESNNNLAWKIK